MKVARGCVQYVVPVAASTHTMILPLTTRPLALTELAAAQGEFIWATLQRLGARAADLADLAQEVLIVVHRKLGTYDPSMPLRPWLYGICVRVLKVHRRRAWFRRELPMAQVPDRVAPGADPERAAIAAQEGARLAALLDELNPEKRAVFVMFELEQLACDEIATLVGVPVGTVWSRLHLARKQLEGALARERAREKGARR
ncbi:MAG: polymerase sigma factor RpoE [Myxococcaceae bacterium]|nr:polymerase sigma factor RpoE [Myxococcaceae bacterium]